MMLLVVVSFSAAVQVLVDLELVVIVESVASSLATRLVYALLLHPGIHVVVLAIIGDDCWTGLLGDADFFRTVSSPATLLPTPSSASSRFTCSACSGLFSENKSTSWLLFLSLFVFVIVDDGVAPP